MKVSTRNASFQQWQALLTNRTKRQRAGRFLVQGVRPITLAVEHGWAVEHLLYPDRRSLSEWARRMLDESGATPVAMAPELIAELGDKPDDLPELLAVVGMPADDLDRVPTVARPLVVVFDRPSTPGNVGTLIRSADAFGATAVVVTGHAADPYDPKAVRASTGSLFAVPVVRAPSHREVLDFLGGELQIIGTDEHGAVDVAEHDLTGPTALVIGNETHGLSAGWREAAERMVRIPITGAASSLNAATAASVILYEVMRQRAR